MFTCVSCHTPVITNQGACPSCGADLGRASVADGARLDGLVIGERVRLESCVGEGAMGWVYRATHLALQSTVAVKIMKPSGAMADGRAARFEQEARAASRLSHPHVITVHDFGETSGGLFYIVSEFVEGETLGQVLARGPLPLGRAVRVFYQILAAVEEAHAMGVIHRDLKPDNVMLLALRSGEDFVKVLDFGIARLQADSSARLTAQGELCGTPAYLAPELIRGRAADARSDLYALGLILYEMVIGHHPFETDAVMEMLAHHLHSEVPDPRGLTDNPQLTDALVGLLRRALEKDPDARFQTVTELRRALAAAVADVDAAGAGCHACHEDRPPWSSRCASCGFAQILPAVPAASGTVGAAQGEAPRRVEPDRVVATGGAPVTVGTSSPKGRSQVATLETLVAQSGTCLGREAELGGVASWLEHGKGALWWMGAAGIGKTTLAQEAARQAAHIGVHVLSYRAASRIVIQPAAALLDLISMRLGLGTSSAQSEERLRASGLDAGDRRALRDLADPASVGQGPAAAVRVREALGVARRILAEPEPGGTLLYVIDDFTELDAVSKRVIYELLQGGRSDVRWLVTSSPEAGPEPGTAQVRTLGPLEREVLEQLLERRVADALPARAREAILDWAQGVPLAALLRAIAMQDDVDDALPPGLGGLLERWIPQMDATQRGILQAVSVAGVLPVRATRDLAPDGGALEQATAALVARELLAGRAGGGLQGASSTRPAAAAWEVPHAAVRVAVRAALGASESVSLQQRVFDALHGAGAPRAALAWPALGARLGDDAVALAVEAADHCRTWGDFDGAAALLRAAQQVARFELLWESRDPRAIELAAHLGEVLRQGGHWLSAELVLREALDAAPEPDAGTLALHSTLCKLHCDRKQWDLAREQALLASRVADGLDLGAQVAAAVLRDTVRAGSGDESAPAELEVTVLLATAAADTGAAAVPPNLWEGLLSLARARYRIGDEVGARQALDRAHAAALRVRDDAGVVAVQLARAADSGLGAEQARAAIEGALEACERLGDRQGMARCHLLRAERFPTERAEAARAALDLSRKIGWSAGQQAAAGLLRAA